MCPLEVELVLFKIYFKFGTFVCTSKEGKVVFVFLLNSK